VLLCVFFGALFRPLPLANLESGGESTAETPNFADMDENEILTKPSKNNSFCCSDQGLPPVRKHLNVSQIARLLSRSAPEPLGSRVAWLPSRLAPESLGSRVARLPSRLAPESLGPKSLGS
jgi:hypothetical protein